jgi:hypothetical protein
VVVDGGSVVCGSRVVYRGRVGDWGRVRNWGSQFSYGGGVDHGGRSVREGSSELGDRGCVGDGCGDLSHGGGIGDWGGDLHGEGLLVDDSVETIVGVGGVLNGALSAIGVNHGVRSLDNITIASFMLGLGVTGQTILNIVSEAVLRMGVLATGAAA